MDPDPTFYFVGFGSEPTNRSAFNNSTTIIKFIFIFYLFSNVTTRIGDEQKALNGQMQVKKKPYTILRKRNNWRKQN